MRANRPTRMHPKSLFPLVLALFAALTVTGRAAAQSSPGSSANLDAKRDIAAKSGFLTDTNRAFPMLFIVGDSTVHNPGRGERGWGDVIGKYFDTNKIRVENHALGGRSSRTFQTQGWWDQLLAAVAVQKVTTTENYSDILKQQAVAAVQTAAAKPGDFLLVQMGHNDGGPLDDTNRARGSIRSLGEETKDIFNPITKQPETVHTYGWYMRKYIADARAKGMTPILCTPVPHCPANPVKDGDIEKSIYVNMATAVATSEKALFINLNQLAMAHYATNTPDGIKHQWFTAADNTHSSPAGAELNAGCVVAGIRALDTCPLRDYLKSE